MGNETSLARLIVVRHDNQSAVGSDIGRCTNPLDRGGGRIGPAAGDYWHPSLRDLDGMRDQLAMLVGAEGRDFARRSARHERIRAFADLPFDELGECVLSDTAAGKWRHQRRNRAEKHELAS